jgi:phenylalanyl-tRNA synthetase beta chain
MRVPLEWLHEYCAPDLPAHKLAERLAMTGTEVERLERHGVSALENFVVGKVLDARQHPDADRLRVCEVDIGSGAPVTIVCGAPNVAAGQTVAVAKPGAVMPDGTKLAKAKLRGIESNGMILAEDEVAIGTEHAGIMVLEQDHLEPGSPLADVLPISTDVLVLEITPNRPDCLGVYGVAREVHAATGAPLSSAPWREDPGSEGTVECVTIEVDCPDLCPRFTARVFDDVQIGPSPTWLKARLMAAGQRPISNVVDITNYVMLLTGQPLHAFDLNRIAGARLKVRRARDGERIETLDGQQRALDPDMVLIEDNEGPTSIAGIMGGARSEVEDGTTRVLMEVANWDGANIHRTSLKLGLRSEASTRFEKQLQPEQAMDAQAVATRLMVDLCGARLAPGTIDVGGPGPQPPTIRLRDARTASLLGAPVQRRRAAEILEALECETHEASDGLDVTPPPFRRGDITREADLIEEVARLDGLEKLPATLPSRHGASGRLTNRQQLRRRAADALIAQGLNEIVGWSFVGTELSRRLRLGQQEVIELENPMSAEQSQLRTTLLGSLLDVAARNLAHGAGTLRLFEAGAVYLPDARGGLAREPYHLGGVLIGPVRESTWRDPQPRDADFFAAKGVIGGLLDTLRIPWSVSAEQQPFLHPGRAASIVVGGQNAGWVGEIHPLVAGEWEIDQTIAAFELDLDRAGGQAVLTPAYEDVTTFPEVREDLAFIVEEAVSAEDLLRVAGASGGPLLQRAEVFDVYRDPERIGRGNVSMALRLSYRAADRTLTDAEVAQLRRAIIVAISEQLGGRVRA